MSQLHVTLGGPEAGWMLLTIRNGKQWLEIYVSAIYPSLFTLAEALLSLLTVQGEQIVTWTCEPAEYDMVFVRNGDTVGLNIRAFPDSRRSKFVRNSVLAASGEYSEICLPFWRALRGLQGRFTESELSERWPGRFPDQILSTLTATLGKGPKQNTVSTLTTLDN